MPPDTPLVIPVVWLPVFLSAIAMYLTFLCNQFVKLIWVNNFAGVPADITVLDSGSHRTEYTVS